MTPDPPGTALLPWSEPEPPVTAFARRVTDLGLGAASLVTNAAVDAVDRFVPGEPRASDARTGVRTGVLGLLPGALVGVGLAAQRGALHFTAAVERGAARVTSVATRAPLIGASVRATEGYLEGWSDRGEEAQARNRALVAEFVRRLAPELATAVVAQLDVEALVDQLPIDGIVARVDADALLDRIDVNTLLERIDVDRIIQRVDVDALMQRVDIVPIAQEVVQEVDIASIVRESTGTIGGDARDGVRITAMRVDGFVGKITDRVLLRRRSRNVAQAGYEQDMQGDE